jgi:putative SOS response-associated peptidase YedK
MISAPVMAPLSENQSQNLQPLSRKQFNAFGHRRRMQPIHERMPVILPLGHEKNWLPPNPSGLFLFPEFPSQLMTAYPVTPKMNKASFNQPDAPLPRAKPGTLF